LVLQSAVSGWEDGGKFGMQCFARAPNNGQMQQFEIYLTLYLSLNSSSSQQHSHLQHCKRQDQNDTSNYFEVLIAKLIK